MKEHSEFSLYNMTKWQLVKNLSNLEKTINRTIKLLDKVSDENVRKAVKILRSVNVRADNKDIK